MIGECFLSVAQVREGLQEKFNPDGEDQDSGPINIPVSTCTSYQSFHQAGVVDL